MRKRCTKVCSAFTLVEMILVVGMMAVITLAMVGMVRATHENWQTVSRRSATLLDGQAVIQQMARILRQAKAITDVSESTDQAGYITFTGVNDNTEEFRLDTATGELLYGDPNALDVLAAPVSSLVFACYDDRLNLLDDPTEKENLEEIRTVAFEATFVDPDDGTLTVTLAGRVFIPTVAVAEETDASGLLFVAADAASLTAQETARKTLIEDWGYEVSLISDGDSQAVFDVAVADANVVYVSEQVSGTALGTKLREAAIGVVSEEWELVDVFGFCQSVSFFNCDILEVSDTSHYITSPFTGGDLTVCSSMQPLGGKSSTASIDLIQLGNIFDPVDRLNTLTKSLLLLESGSDLYGGGTAAGRRVQLPWGGVGFNINELNSDGQTIMRRAIEWAEVVPEIPAALLFVVGNTGSLTPEQADKKALIESWNYVVTSIGTNSLQAAFDTAVAAADVVYIPELGTTAMNQLGSKLDAAQKGVITEESRRALLMGIDGAASPFVDDDSIEVIDNTHYITSTLSTGTVPIATSVQTLWILEPTLATDLNVLGQLNGTDPGLACVEANELLNDGNPAPGRRVKLPWGAYNYDINLLTDDGLTIMRRAIEWAKDSPAYVAPNPDMYVHDITMAWRKQGPRYFGQATVWVKDENGDDVEGATVSGTWSGSVSGTDSGDTAADGTVMHESSGVNGGGTYIFTVDSITKDGFTYNAALNVESSGMIVAP